MSEAKNRWRPPEFVTREQCIKDTEDVLARPDIPIKRSEDIFRVNVLGLDWDLGMVVYEPKEPKKIPRGADGKTWQPDVFAKRCAGCHTTAVDPKTNAFSAFALD